MGGIVTVGCFVVLLFSSPLSFIMCMTAEDARNHLSKEQIFEFKQAFDIFDQDGGGDISTRELGRVMKLLGQNPTPQELDKIIEEGKTASEEDLKEMFRFMDKNGDSYIDYDEFCNALDGIPADPPVVPWEIEELFMEADRNKDGKVDIDEWVQWMDDVKTH